MESPAANMNVASSPIVQPGYANPGQPAPVPVIVMASPYYAQGPAMPYAAPQAQNNKSKMWILGIIAVCLVLFVILGIIGIVVRVYFMDDIHRRNCKILEDKYSIGMLIFRCLQTEIQPAEIVRLKLL